MQGWMRHANRMRHADRMRHANTTPTSLNSARLGRTLPHALPPSFPPLPTSVSSATSNSTEQRTNASACSHTCRIIPRTPVACLPPPIPAQPRGQRRVRQRVPGGSAPQPIPTQPQHTSYYRANPTSAGSTRSGSLCLVAAGGMACRPSSTNPMHFSRNASGTLARRRVRRLIITQELRTRREGGGGSK